TDGIVQPLRASFAAGLPFPVEYHRVGTSGENVALTSLTVRTSAQSRAAYLHVQNFGQQSRSVSVEWRADSHLLDVRPLTLPAGGQPVGIGRVRAIDAGDPLLANVELQDVHVARSQDLRNSAFGRPLISSLQTPLVLVRDEPFRQVLVGFDLHESDLPLRIAFPILVQNLSEWLLPPSVPSHSFHPDEPVTIVPESGATSVSVSR